MIIWGTKRVVKNLGRVADFCPICRQIKSFKLSHIGMAGHIYYISLVEGKLVGNQISCESCGVLLMANLTDYSSISKNKMAELNQLICDTHRNVEQRYADRLAIEKKLQTTGVTPEQRVDLIREPLILMNGEANRGTSGIQLGWIGIISIIMFFVSLGYLIANFSSQDSALFTRLVLIGLTLASLAGIIFDGIRTPRQFLRKKVFPNLAKAFKPIRPSISELEEQLRFLKIGGYLIGTKVKAVDLYEAIEADVNKPGQT